MEKDTIKAIREYVEELPARLELQVAIARIQRKRFKALLKEGFTESQALELCKNILA